MPNLLYSTAGPVAGAGYTDVAARLPLLWVKFFAALLASALAVVCVFRVTSRTFLAGVAAYALALVSGAIFPAMLQRFSVAPNELVKETPYIKSYIAATRKAFGLDGVQERELTGEKTLSARTSRTISAPSEHSLVGSAAAARYLWADSGDSDLLRVPVRGQRPLSHQRRRCSRSCSPPELLAASLPNRNWINERLTFTHGFGLTVGPVAKATGEGLPVCSSKTSRRLPRSLAERGSP